MGEKKNVMLAIARLTGGGAERVVSIWANMLNKRGYNVTVLIAYRSEDEYELDKGINIITIAENERDYKSVKHFRKIGIIRRSIKLLEIDTIISFLPSMQIIMSAATFALKCKRIETIRVNPWFLKQKFTGIRFVLWNNCFKRADTIVVQTKEQADFFDSRLRAKCVVVPNPTSEKFLMNYKTIFQDTIKRFIAAGRICEQKNYEMMIKSFAEVVKDNPEVVLDIYGTGEESYIATIRSLIETLGMQDHISLKGRAEHMEKIYQEYDAFLMSSKYEGLPTALIEAMLSKLVCVSTDCKTGPKDLIDDGINGYLSPVDVQSSFEERIRKLLMMDRNSIEQMGKYAREKVTSMCAEEKSIQVLCKVIDD